jgi:hypothetical protein
MKQYTTPEQTAKLIELGLPKPKTPISYSYPDQSEQQKAYEASLGLDPYLATVDQIEFEYAYSIGELIEMLPTSVKIKGYDCFLYIEPMHYDGDWNVGYMRYNAELNQRATELIDAVYDMVITLKEEGVI